MRVADYLFCRLADWGVTHVFLVTGGGAMYLNDALGREERLQYVCNLHEQACAMAAEGYARVSGRPGVVSVTTGPGGSNALTGVMGAWLDSIPMLVISGQVKRATMTASYPELGLRQLGDQEFNIVDCAKTMTKWAYTVMDVKEVCFALEKAWWLCQHGRPGPVWLDVPLDIQAAEIPPEEELVHFTPPLEHYVPSGEVLAKVCEKLKTAQRPVLVAGGGIRTPRARAALHTVAEKFKLPVLTTIGGIDVIESDHPLFFGRPGILGDRAANLILQNSDVLIMVGARMGIRTIGYAYNTFARAAWKVMVDVDPAELRKPTLHPDLGVVADAGAFLEALAAYGADLSPVPAAWRARCAAQKRAYPIVLAAHRARTDYVSSYVLPGALASVVPDDTIVVTGNGVAYTSTYQALPVKKGMRVFANQACASMGYGLPAAIGAACAGKGRLVCCITGDGSIQMNCQELQTLVNYRLPIKIFVYNNQGYLSIKLTQRAFFGGRFMGSEAHSGVRLPSLEKLASAYGIAYVQIDNNSQLIDRIQMTLAREGPVLVEVMSDPFEELGPKAASRQLPDGRMISAPLEDLAPFLPRTELEEQMSIALLPEF